MIKYQVESYVPHECMVHGGLPQLTVHGGLCVMMAGIWRMPQWCVVNWDKDRLWVCLVVLLLEREVIESV